MVGKKFLQTVSNDQEDILQLFLDILKKVKADYCVVGGLGVNAYVEPVVSLDLDVVVDVDDVGKVCKEAEAKGLGVKKFEHSVNLNSPKSDLRIQIQTDRRYQKFLSGSSAKVILGYEMKVASKEDVLKGKIWAYSDEKRRKSKRQKDLTDIMRMIEVYPSLERDIPAPVLDKLK